MQDIETSESVAAITALPSAGSPPLPHSIPAQFTKIPVRPFVILIVTDAQGEVVGVLSGESEALPLILKAMEAEDGLEVSKRQDSLTPLAQDMYIVERDFVLGLRSVLWLWEGARELPTILPEGCTCTFVINY